MLRRRHQRVLAGSCLLAVALGFAATAATATQAPSGRANRMSAPALPPPVVLPNGRLLQPVGQRYDLGDFPVGLAVSPDGRLAVASKNGAGLGIPRGFDNFCEGGIVSAPKGCGQAKASLVGDPHVHAPDEGLDVIDLASGKVTDVKAVPTSYDPAHPRFNFFSIGVAFSPDSRHVYAVGGANQAVYDFTVTGSTLSSPPRVLKLPETVSKTPVPSQLEAQLRAFGSPKSVAVTPNGKTLLVVQEFQDELDLVDAATLALHQRIPLGPTVGQGGFDPYQVAVSPAGDAAYVSMEGAGTVAKVVLSKDTAVLVGAAAAGDHPTGLAISPDGGQVVVANAAENSVSVLDAATMAIRQKIVVQAVPGEAYGSIPNAVAFSRDGTRVYVALAGDNAVAVLSRARGGAVAVAGLVPAGWYPTGVAVRPTDGSVVALSAKGLGSRYVPSNSYPAPSSVGPAGIPNSYYYDVTNIPGLLTRWPPPPARDLAADTDFVRSAVRYAADADQRTPNNPVPAAGGPTPITHVVYIVRENRTFDQIFGDLGATRHDVDANPAFENLASATPNAHAIQRQFATSDRFFSDGEASVQGHWWTTAAAVSDHVEKGFRQYDLFGTTGEVDSGRKRLNEAVAPVSTPKGCTLFQSALAKSVASGGAFTFRDYGEAVGVLSPDENGAGRSNPCSTLPVAFIDRNFDTELTNTTLTKDDRPRAREFLADSGIGPNGEPVGQPAVNFLRNFSYVTLPEDHTTGLNSVHTPRSEVAQNDGGLGILVAGLSKSRYWPSTAVFVVEDDSQDGADHVDGHRNVLLVASPWTKHVGLDGRTPGFISHRHHDQAGVIRTMELLLGLPPMSAFDQNAAPLYDLFQDKREPHQLTAGDLTPYQVAAAPPFIDETVASLKGHKAAALKAASRNLDTSRLDSAGPGLEAVLWASTTDRPMPGELRRRLGDIDQRSEPGVLVWPPAIVAAAAALVSTRRRFRSRTRRDRAAILGR